MERVPTAPDGPTVVLVSADTPVERAVIDDWLDQAGSGAGDGAVERVPATGPALQARLSAGDDPLLVPVRVAWLPAERKGQRRARWSDLLLMTNPRRPRPRVQRRIVRRAPDRWRVVMAEPAYASELRQRWSIEAGDTSVTSTGGGQRAFAAFVGRQATLALERAERGVIGDRYKVPRLVAEQIMASQRFRSELAEIAQSTGQPIDVVTAQAAERLREVVSVQSRLAADLLFGALAPAHNRAWTARVGGLDLEQLRGLNRKHSLVFLPTHRSYMDPLILDAVLSSNDFPPNHKVAGDNLSFWPFGPLGRRAGVVFIRRSFGDDQLYKLAVREYFGYLAAKRFNMEWYLEGGRSRTGKLRPPRFGILQYLVDAVRSGRAEDAYLVPVSITFDQLPEVGAMADEQRGGSKQREGFGWLARTIKAHQRPLGTVHVRFAEPLSLRRGLEAAGTDDQRLAMQKVAFEVCTRMNRATPVLAVALVPLALLGAHDRALTLEQVCRVVDPLLDYVAARKLPASGLDELRRPSGVRNVLTTLCRHGVVTAYAEGTEPVYAIEPGQHLVAAYYRNNAIHWFVNRAIVELAAVRVGDAAEPLEQAWAEALALRDLLKYEFFFADKAAFRDELAAELDLLDPDWRAAPPPRVERAERVLAGAPFLAAPRVLRSFVESYLVVADRLADRDPRKPIERKEFLAECVAVGKQYVLQRRIHSAESVSSELFSGALRLAANRDLTDPGRDELAERRRRFAREVAAVADAIAVVDRIDAARWDRT
jgi:glycerol-3-phosphate O-acyltransferase